MKYDAVVIGAGAGGGVAAYVLAMAGKRVLLLERGEWMGFAEVGRDHLRNHRLARYGHGTGPPLEGFPRVSNGRVVQPIDGDYQNIASCVGSGTLVYGGQAWRFHPLDFRMASTYGVPAGSSLADWPITYEDLDPYYEKVEQELGVAGGPPAPQMPARAAYPLPPVRETARRSKLEVAARALGWATQYPPLLINTEPRHGRAACAECQHCVGFACPTNAKNGTWNTVIPTAIGTGRLDVWSGVQVTRLVGKSQGGIESAEFTRTDGSQSSIEAEVFVVSCSAIETARLLLNSGVQNDHLGRHLQGHYYVSACAEMPEPVYDGIGPGSSIATLEFSHGNEGVIGGGMLADDFITLPIVFEKWHRPPDVPAWGPKHKEWMRRVYPRMLDVKGPVQDIPSPTSRVQTDPTVTDKWGVPVASLSGTTHPETVRTTQYLTTKAVEWLVAAGAVRIWGKEPGLGMSAGQHQAGTCRMGDDPAQSVVSATGKVHGYENLFVADGSVHVTNGGFNPVLTIMATAWRTADLLALAW